MEIPEVDEAELKVATTMMYRKGGVQNVLTCIAAMQKVQLIIMGKLAELLDEEEKL